MKKLTEMQLLYVANRAAGVRQKDAAVAAGYSALTADRQASAMERRDDIKKAIAKERRSLKSSGELPPGKTQEEDDISEKEKRQRMPRAKYDDPIVFLTDLMNHKHMPVAMRADAAKQLLPYKHARIAEKGKKDTKKEIAAQLAGGSKPAGTKSKWATKQPPPSKPNLHVVGGNG